MAVITEDGVRKLAELRSETSPVVSCYLDVDGARLTVRKAYEQELERLVRSAGSRPELAAATRDDLRRMEDHVKAGIDRSRTRGLAMFSCAEIGLWEVVELPVPVYNRIVLDPSPAVLQLESALGRLERFAVLLVDKARARIFVYGGGELIDRSEMIGDSSRDLDIRGLRDQGFDREQHHVEELTNQHIRNAASATFEVFRAHGFEHLSVGAPDEIVQVVEHELHPYLRDRLAPRIMVDVAAGPDEIRVAAAEVQVQVEKLREAAVVSRLRDAVGSANKGVAGLDDTLAALVERRVDTLVVSRGYTETGWRCPKCGALYPKGPRCPVDDTEMVHLDDVVEATVDVAFRQSCRVEVCTDNADLDVLGRIGALLRF